MPRPRCLLESLESRQLLSAAIIVDDTAATLSGTWISSTYTKGYYGSDYLQDENAAGGKSATFTPTLPAYGQYQVFARWTAASNRATNVPIDIFTTTGTTTGTVNQQKNSGIWVLLGTYNLSPSSAAVRIRNDGANGYVIADAVEFLPAPAIIVDDKQATLTGTWTASTYTPGYYGSDYLNDGNTAKGTKSATFTPALPLAGEYQVLARWPAAANRATNTPITIASLSGSATISVNQQQNNNTWVVLGTYDLAPGADSVTINTTGTNGYVIADAVEFVPITVNAELQNAITFAQQQLNLTATADLNNNPNEYPNYTLSNGTWSLTNSANYGAGAFPMSLWQMYELTGNPNWETLAQTWTAPLATAENASNDTFLRIYEPFLSDYTLTGSATAQQAIIDAAAAKITTYNPTVGAFQTSWRASTSGNPAANFGVLIDQTMDLQSVFYAAALTGNTTWYNDAVTACETVEKYLIRPDGSTAQWAYFNSTTGQFIDNETYAGYSASSTWARGQAWGIYSFAAAYAATGRPDFLAADESMADYFINNLPPDSIPYWDFNAPGIPNTYRDTSAAAIAASGLLQLAKIDPNQANAQRYYNAAAAILASLAASPYLAQGTPSHGILLQGAAMVPGPDPIPDTSIAFGDSYFLEATRLFLDF